MKKTVSVWLIISLLLSGAFFSLPSKAQASDGSQPVLQTIFIDTLYGMATGMVLAAAITAAKGEGHGSEWGENLGAGAAVGGLLGAGYGIFLEYNQGLAELQSNKVCFHIPTASITSGSIDKEIAIRADLLRIRF